MTEQCHRAGFVDGALGRGQGNGRGEAHLVHAGRQRAPWMAGRTAEAMLNLARNLTRPQVADGPERAHQVERKHQPASSPTVSMTEGRMNRSRGSLEKRR